MTKVGDAIQLTSEDIKEWFGTLWIVEKVKDWGVQAFAYTYDGGIAYIRLSHDEYKVIGKAAYIKDEELSNG